MTGQWLIDLAVFVLATVAAHQGQAGLTTYLGQKRRTADRLKGLAGEEAGNQAIELRRSLRGGNGPLTRWLARLIVQSGTTRPPAALCAMAVALGLALLLVLPGAAPWSLRLPFAFGLGGLAVVVSLRIMRRRRIARFGECLPEILDIITRSLRAGHPLPVSLGLVARETPAPPGRNSPCSSMRSATGAACRRRSNASTSGSDTRSFASSWPPSRSGNRPGAISARSWPACPEP